jgi:hypothetical protein
MVVARSIAAALVVLVACSRDDRDEGLPPATEWRAIPGSATAPPPQAARARAPHGPIGTDVSKLGMPAPDPKRTLDPTHHVGGVIKLTATTKDRAPAGAAVFVIAKHADANGQPAGPPLAVQKLTWATDELAFDLTERQAMIAGTQLTGDVIVSARYDQDGDALTKQPGDLTGSVRVTIPAEHVEIALDHILP